MNTNKPLGPLMVDLGGTRISAGESRLLLQPAVGGVILFDRNFESIKQVSALIQSIKSIRTPALLVAVDQEGGRVQRFKEEFFRLPAVYRFGKRYEHDPGAAITLARYAGCLMASQLVRTGVDFSFAPVLDCAQLDSKVIGDRGFHENPEIIASLGEAFIDGMNQSGMAATGKHFPGHGGVIEDSHLSLPVDKRPLDQLFARDLIPYIKLSKKLQGVMTAHVQFPEIDPEIPAFSSFWLDQVLRRDLGFGGVIFSDDLSMKGACVGGDVLERTKSALNAGCDMVLICNDFGSANMVAENLGTDLDTNQSRLTSMYADAKLSAQIDTTLMETQLTQLA